MKGSGPYLIEEEERTARLRVSRNVTTGAGELHGSMIDLSELSQRRAP